MTRVTRGKVSVGYQCVVVGLRDVLLPRETWLSSKDLPSGYVENRMAVFAVIKPEEEMPRCRLVPRNRERELGLDRRETG